MGLRNNRGQKHQQTVIHDRKSKSCLQIDFFRLIDDKNIALKEVKKISKNKDLEIEINWMWNVKTKVAQVVVRALGTSRKDFEKGVELIPGRSNVSKITKPPYWTPLTFYGNCLNDSMRALVLLWIHPSSADKPIGIT